MSKDTASALSCFHPLIAEWFGTSVGPPTPVQALAWPRIAAGEHLLVTAPTGSGKTLTAFLWALDRLLTASWEGGRVRVLYISPLRALNNDIQRNLLTPLAALGELSEERGVSFQAVRVETRSGDTPPGDRRKMIRHPPEILITTPESLNILLTSKSGSAMLRDVTCVILDEIHAVAGNKRGVLLSAAVERLTLLAGEFQRIALSATVRPPQEVARFVGGGELEPGADGEAARYRPRPVAVVKAPTTKQYELEVVSVADEATANAAGGPLPDSDPSGLWEPLIAHLKARIRRHGSTLLFANSRRLTEKVTRLLNEGETNELAYSHHGSLSREIRSVVEARLKQGQLAAIVATSSLELGIDIGALDEVALIKTPPSVAAAVQRLGRAGHGVGEVSHGRLYPLFAADLLEAVVVARGVLDQDIEQVRPVVGALDVLAQVIVSMVAVEPWSLQRLYDFVRTIYSYRELTRRQFDLVVEMLAGRYADSRVRELRPRVSVDGIEGTIRARGGVARLVYLSGGTIPDRGYFHLRRADTKAKVGELDEEFVWERSVGDSFTLGAQSWRIQAVTHNDVLVTPSAGSAAMAPFWRAEERDRSFHLSARIGDFLETADELLAAAKGGKRLRELLESRHAVGRSTAEALVRHLEDQRSTTGCSLPHRRHLVIERLDPAGAPERQPQIVVHTGWGGRVHRPLALALAAAWEDQFGTPLAIEHDNDCLLLGLSSEAEFRTLLERVRPDNLEQLLRHKLEGSGYFGGRFRENAGRALLLPRASFKRRVPLWLNRQRAKKLQAAVTRYGDFPLLLETWRTCLQDEFELESLKGLLAELEEGEIRWSEAVTTSPSPFATEIIWRQTNRLMYASDAPEVGETSGLRGDLLQELVHSSQLRPRLPLELVDRFERKLQRLYPGYAPQQSTDLIEWVRERQALPEDEWQLLLVAVQRDAALDGAGMDELLKAAAGRLVRCHTAAMRQPLVVHVESLPRLARSLELGGEAWEIQSLTEWGEEETASGAAGVELAQEMLDHSATTTAGAAVPDTGAEREHEADPLTDLVGEWIRFYGPFQRQWLMATLGLDEVRLVDVLEMLLEEERIVIDHFRPGAEGETALEICDSENLERLLRLLRARQRPSFRARPLDELPLLLALRQGLHRAQGEPETLKAALEGLFGYAAPARLWEADLLPARLDPYYTAWLDALMQESDLLWLGCGRESLTFALAADLDLLRLPTPLDSDSEESGAFLDEIFPDPHGRYRFEEVLRASGEDSAAVSRRLWQASWTGRVSNTSFAVVRQGVAGRFRPVEIGVDSRPAATGSQRLGGTARLRFGRWQATRPMAGEWYRLAPLTTVLPAMDALEVEEENRERVRLLLRRYGVLFRELLLREKPALRWSELFRSLRLMELSGEVLSGQFFEGIQGLQFISPAAFQGLREGLPEDTLFWMNAVDAASPCGLGLEGWRGELPARRPSNHLAFHGSRLVVVSQRNGADLDVRVGPRHPHLLDYLDFLKVQLTRQFHRRRQIVVERINGLPAAGSPYARSLAEIFSTSRGPGSLTLRRRF